MKHRKPINLLIRWIVVSTIAISGLLVYLFTFHFAPPDRAHLPNGSIHPGAVAGSRKPEFGTQAAQAGMESQVLLAQPAVEERLKKHYSEFIQGKRTKIDWEFEWQQLTRKDWQEALALLVTSDMQAGGDIFRFRAFVAGLPEGTRSNEIIDKAKDLLSKRDVGLLVSLLLPRAESGGPVELLTYISENVSNLNYQEFGGSLASAINHTNDPFKSVFDLYMTAVANKEYSDARDTLAHTLKVVCGQESLSEAEVIQRLTLLTDITDDRKKRELSEDVVYRNPSNSAKILANSPDAKLAGTAMGFWSREDPLNSGEWLNHEGANSINRSALIAGYAAAVGDEDPVAAQQWLLTGGTESDNQLASLKEILGKRIRTTLPNKLIISNSASETSRPVRPVSR